MRFTWLFIKSIGRVTIVITFFLLLFAGTSTFRLEAQSSSRSPIFKRNYDILTRLPNGSSSNSAQGVVLQSILYLPQGNGPFPLVVINHGSPRNPGDRRRVKNSLYESASRWFADRGYAVVVPFRRGYANSEGEFAEGYESCRRPNYVKAGLATADDIVAVVQHMQRQSFILGDRIVLVGQSAGGWGVLAAASRNPRGVVGAINFAGGRGSYADNENCSFQALIDGAGAYGTTAKIPTLWIYTANDRYFGPQLSRRMFAQFARSSPQNDDFVLLPDFGGDGHSLFAASSGRSQWGQHVQEFLNRLAPISNNFESGSGSATDCELVTSDGRTISSALLCPQ